MSKPIEYLDELIHSNFKFVFWGKYYPDGLSVRPGFMGVDYIVGPAEKKKQLVFEWDMSLNEDVLYTVTKFVSVRPGVFHVYLSSGTTYIIHESGSTLPKTSYSFVPIDEYIEKVYEMGREDYSGEFASKHE